MKPVDIFQQLMIFSKIKTIRYLKRKQQVFCFVILFLIYLNPAYSQSDKSRSAPNQLYIEAAGPGGYGSLNYERKIFEKNDLQVGVRCGFSTYHVNDYTNNFNPDILIPIALNGYYGKIHKFQFGVGQTFTNMVQASSKDFMPIRNTNFHTFFSIGYEYQKKPQGVFFRITYTPVIEFNMYFRHWAGVSTGFSF